MFNQLTVAMKIQSLMEFRITKIRQFYNCKWIYWTVNLNRWKWFWSAKKSVQRRQGISFVFSILGLYQIFMDFWIFVFKKNFRLKRIFFNQKNRLNWEFDSNFRLKRSLFHRKNHLNWKFGPKYMQFLLSSIHLSNSVHEISKLNQTEFKFGIKWVECVVHPL